MKKIALTLLTCFAFCGNSDAMQRIAVIELTPETRTVIAQIAIAQIQKGGCGICTKEGGEIWFPNPKNNCAHESCWESLKPVGRDALKKINENCDITHGYQEQNNMCRNLITEVLSKCNGKTLLEYLNEFDKENLKKIFDDSVITVITNKQLQKN